MAESWEREKSEKIALTRDSNPRPGNVELPQYAVEEKRGKRPMIAYCLTQCSNGCSLGSFLFPRQDHHVQRCAWRLKSTAVYWQEKKSKYAQPTRQVLGRCTHPPRTPSLGTTSHLLIVTIHRWHFFHPKKIDLLFSVKVKRYWITFIGSHTLRTMNDRSWRFKNAAVQGRKKSSFLMPWFDKQKLGIIFFRFFFVFFRFFSFFFSWK